MIDDTPIKASWFYWDDSEKTKFNWFLYEYACTLYDHIRRSKNETLNRWRAKHSNKQVAEFCAYFSKRMRQSVLDSIARHAKETIGDEEYICDYCHTNTLDENGAILETAVSAWSELLEICVICPERCITERDNRSMFFDRTG